MERLRVAFLIPTFDIGGAERMVVRLAAGLDPARFDTEVLAFTGSSAALLPLLQQLGVRGAALGGTRTPRLVLPARLLKRLARKPVHVLMTYMFHANLAGRLARLLGLVPALVCSERVVGWESAGRIRINRLTVRWADVVTTNSQAGRAFWSERLGIAPDEVRVIPNGVDVEDFSPPHRRVNEPRIGVLARLHRANGHEWFVDGLARLNQIETDPWTCIFAGSGPEEPQLRQLVAARSLESRIQFAGHCADAPGFLRSIQMLAHPSLVSGMPNVVLEAMATGLPVVATAVGGTPEVVEHGRSGFLVQPGDVNATADRLRMLLLDPPLRTRIGGAARARVEAMFSVQTAVSRTETIIQDLARLRLGLEYAPGAGWGG